MMKIGSCTPAHPHLVLPGDPEARKWRHTLPKPFESLFISERGGQDGWRSLKDRDTHTHTDKKSYQRPSHSCPPASPSSRIVPSDRKWSVWPLTLQECLPSLSQLKPQQQQLRSGIRYCKSFLSQQNCPAWNWNTGTGTSENESRLNRAPDAIRQKRPVCSHGAMPTSVGGIVPRPWLSCLWP